MAISNDEFDLDAHFEAANAYADVADALDDFVCQIVAEEDPPLTTFDVGSLMLFWVRAALEGADQEAVAAQVWELLKTFDALPLHRNFRLMNGEQLARFEEAMKGTANA